MRGVLVFFALVACCAAFEISQETLLLANTTSPSELMLFKMEIWELVNKSVNLISEFCKAQTYELYENQKQLAAAVGQLQDDMIRIRKKVNV